MNTVTKIELIWDRDHGRGNEGWYARLTLADGRERDQSLDGDRRAGWPSLLPQALAEAESWGMAVAPDAAVEVKK